MRQVFYIEADEEMISVIGRLRKSSATENIIVAPQRSLILQSIVNLRLLQHDARKSGKEIIVVTQDPQSKALCEKIGIQTQPSLEEYNALLLNPSHGSMSSHGEQPETLPAPTTMPVSLPDQEVPVKTLHFPHSDTIGSADFFEGQESVSASVPLQQYESSPSVAPVIASEKDAAIPVTMMPSAVRHIPVRDKNPQIFPSLNSQRFEEEKRVQQQTSFTPPSLRNASPVRPVFAPTVFSDETIDSGVLQEVPSQHEKETTHPLWFRAPDVVARKTDTNDFSQASQIMMPRRVETPSLATAPVARPLPEKKVVVQGGDRMKAFFVFFLVVSLLTAAIVGAYVFLPKADIEVKLKTFSQQADFEFNASTKITATSVSEKTLPVRLIEKDGEITQSFNATGALSLADKKSRGTVIITNNFSADAQVLVASTRVVSVDGKVFRLQNSVTVPGMTSTNGQNQAGTIEAVVIADQSGADSNLDATTFTIPGFQGSPKYTKFTVKSLKPMTGGGSSGADVRVVSTQDIADAKKSLETDIQKQGQNDIAKELAPNEKIIDGAVESTVLSSMSTSQAGIATESFEYTVKIHSRALVFDEAALKTMIGTLFTQQNTAKGISFSPDMIMTQYGEPTVDFAEGTLRIKVHAIGKSDASLDIDQLKSDVLGQREDAINDILKKYTGIETMTVSLWPSQLPLQSIPTQANRVTIYVNATFE